nr:TRAP transporter small permease [Metabacillus lacus]
MVVTALWQVFSRYVLNSPSTVSEELLRYLLIWVSILGGAYAFGEKKHLAISFFVNKLPEGLHKGASIFVEFLLIGFAGLVLIYGGLNAVILTTAQTSAALGIPLAFIYGVLPVAGVLIIGYSVLDLLQFNRQESRKQDFKQAI